MKLGKRAKMFIPSAVAVGVICVSEAAFAASGISKVDTLLDKIQTGLLGAGVVVIGCAIMWAGYKLAFCHSSMGEIIKPVGGAVLIGSAASIASWLMS